jgi:N-acetylglucosamine-6-phosphate deacetylase
MLRALQWQINGGRGHFFDDKNSSNAAWAKMCRFLRNMFDPPTHAN